MRCFVFIVFSLLAFPVYASECLGKEKGTETSFENHIKYAKQIYLGQVINAYLTPGIYEIVFEFKVSGIEL